MAIFGLIFTLIFLSAPIFSLFESAITIGGVWYVLISILTGFFGAFIESLNLPLDDNFTTPTFTAIFLAVLVYLALAL